MYVEVISLLCVKWGVLDYEESGRIQAMHLHLAMDALGLLLLTLPWLGNGYRVRIRYWLRRGNETVFTHAFLLFTVVWVSINAKH